MSVVGRTRVRTEQNSIARDIVQVGERLLFGYNVFIGLKKETKISDVFSLFDLTVMDDGLQLEEVSLDKTFLSEQRFQSDFEELYRYYKDAKLINLVFRDSKLLAGFQIGERIDDIRVFRWSVSADGKEINYIDNRGERDIQPPAKYDFEWIETTRNDFIHGRFPHVNIMDTVFVETINGDLTIKVEDNTEDGLGIYSEAVDEKNQSMDDASISYAKVNNLILLAITPYKEEETRYLIYNMLTEEVLRIDAIGQSCVQLPEEQGVIFPGGFYLASGTHKKFTDEVDGLQFKRMYRSPNGEDVLYVFYEPVDGVLALFSYNLITKSTLNPIFSNGYALYGDGKMIVFSAEEEATRVHPMQLWQSPFVSAEHASQQPESTTELGKIGNSELVRGVSNLYEIARSTENQQVSMRLYEALSQSAVRVFDAHYWLEDSSNKEIAGTLRDISSTSELVIDEFEKVQSIQRQSARVMLETKTAQKKLLAAISTTSWEDTMQFVNAIHELREQRGHIITVKDHRYINVDELNELEQEVLKTEEELGLKTVEFLIQDDALKPYETKLNDFEVAINNVQKNAEIKPLVDEIDQTTGSLDLLSELVTTLPIDDATIRTNVVDAISEIYAKLNQIKARASNKRKNLGSEEAVAQFSAQFKLFSQSITNALGIAETPEKCDEQLSRLLVQLEDLESQFSDYDQFLSDIMDKREELYESFETHRQSLVEQQQRRAQTIADSASRILSSIEKRSLKLVDKDKLNTYFASDALVLKVRDLIAELQALGSAVIADDIDARFKALKEQAIRSLRDKSEIFEDGGKIIKLGPKHKFSVNTQELDLTMVPRNDALFFHLTGTDFYEKVDNDELVEMQDYWPMSLESETPDVYRSEYLAHLVIDAAETEQSGLNRSLLNKSMNDLDALTKIVRDFSTPLYKQAYQKGIHDHDAALILQQLLPAITAAGLLRFSPKVRGLAQLFWVNIEQWLTTSSATSSINLAVVEGWPDRAKAALKLRELFADVDAIDLLNAEIESVMTQFFNHAELEVNQTDINLSAHYLLEQIGTSTSTFVASKYTKTLCDQFVKSLGKANHKQFNDTLQSLTDRPIKQWLLASAWLNAFINKKADENLLSLKHYIDEAVAQLCCQSQLKYTKFDVDLELSAEGLLGEHERVADQTLNFSVDDFMQRMHYHQHHVLPNYTRYLELRSDITKAERAKIKLDSFQARPLSSFVRNRLINESYLPLIGDNLAKQMGTAGDAKRTDLMGLLMMISPPGYGKTTLMEYVASRLGLIFMKINCPALGHDVMSLDPQQAPNATARQELEKINLAFEMGNNVMLYLDDIQHTHPEFLQKYISLCDGTRRVEGVWRGETKTYDMRGKKFCVVMAGNPYTESGEQFKVPDMLANRADIYNLGDILGGMDEQFALSYIENSLTSNQVLAPLAVREMDDVYKLVSIAKGSDVPSTDLSHQYSGAEINEITDVLKKMFTIQDIVLKINKEYIASAAQDDRYRVEPPFKLQGSYRNMNKMTEKISAVMNEEELMQLIEDHYLGESQLLTTGAEENLLKLAELRGNMTPEQAARWQQILNDFKRNKSLGGDETNVGNKIATQMNDLVGAVEELGSLSKSLATNNAQRLLEDAKQAENTQLKTLELESKQLATQQKHQEKLLNVLAEINTSLTTQRSKDADSTTPAINITNQPLPEFANILNNLVNVVETGILPIVGYMEKKFEIDKRTLAKIHDVATEVSDLHVEVAKNVNVVRRKKTPTKTAKVSKQTTKRVKPKT